MTTSHRIDAQTLDNAVRRAHELREQAIADAWGAVARWLHRLAARHAARRRHDTLQWG